MAEIKAKWVKLVQNGSGPGARSSHAITVIGQKAYVFGGEFTPRVPVDNKIHVFDLIDQTWSVLDVTGDAPPPRVGGTIYVFGGRDAGHQELNELYSFDTYTKPVNFNFIEERRVCARWLIGMSVFFSCDYRILTTWIWQPFGM